ncbi:ribonuclease P protein component [Actinokineospora sp. NBRC 105648]|uniref:ribonuclease P protein component n=1 Tax=Actinokineospora sp. NBRC 105648 TaxID=3032206 RepID=UPI0024A1F8A4|nr:ribonuclease P protein component [Actinokineospora sp. NBRC 105648]GLZ37385.1 ribonuclease P protein component [Actinokineospora sp. NBRC 105648]
MLPAAARLTSSADFRMVTKNGRRAGRPRLVVHAVTDRVRAAPLEADSTVTRSPVPPRVGFVVSKAVGNAVVRHRVARRLRHVARDRIGTLLPGSTLVVRALPRAATATSAELDQDFEAAIRRLHLVRDNGADDGGGA